MRAKGIVTEADREIAANYKTKPHDRRVITSPVFWARRRIQIRKRNLRMTRATYVRL